MTTKTEEFDVTLQPNEAAWLCRVIGERYPGVSAAVTDRRGPGGGWPVIKATGPDDQVDRLRRDYDRGAL